MLVASKIKSEPFLRVLANVEWGQMLGSRAEKCPGCKSLLWKKLVLEKSNLVSYF